MNKQASSKGQSFSLEVVITLSFFIAAVIAFMVAWNSIFSSYQDEAVARQMQASLLGISDALVLSPGNPPDWEAGLPISANSFGFASSRGILSEQKIAALQSLNSSYSLAKEKLGAGAYEIHIEVASKEGAVLYSFGKPLDLQEIAYSSAIERLAILNGQLVKVKVQLWKSKR